MFSGHNVFGYVIINAVSNSKNNCTVATWEEEKICPWSSITLSRCRCCEAIKLSPAQLWYLMKQQSNCRLAYTMESSEACVMCIAPWFYHSVYTAVYVIFSFLAFFWFFPFSFYVGQDGMSRKEEKMRPKRENYMNCRTQKLYKIRDYYIDSPL